MSSVKVFCRIRPAFSGETLSTYDVASKEKADNLNFDSSSFAFTKVFSPSATNNDVYTTSVKPLITKWLHGFNGTIFAYGQTGSGKSHTIFGHFNPSSTSSTTTSSSASEQKGVIYSALSDIFKTIETSSTRKFILAVSYLEVYNESVADLLADEKTPLQVREVNGVFYAENLTEEIVYNEEQAMKLLALGNSRKTMGYSYVNDKSSRSHTVFRLTLASVPRDGESPRHQPFVSELNFADLAGAELLSYDFGHQQQQETKAVNLSLFSLKSVINALAEKASFIPYRNSMLTKLLQNSLGGNSYTTMLCTISPAAEHVSISKRTLQFGQVAKKVSNRPKKTVLAVSENIVKLRAKEDVDLVEVKIAEQDQKSREKQRAKEINKAEKMMEEMRKDLWVTTPAGNVYCAMFGEASNPVAIVIHGYPSDHEEWSYLYEPLVGLGFYVCAVDMPGFGKSSGDRQSSRTEKHLDKNGTVDVIFAIMSKLGVTASKQCVLIGYDWGGGIALSLATKYPKLVSKIVCFHPSWTETLALLNKVPTKTCLLWVPVDQLHPLTTGSKMVRALPNGKLVKLVCGKFTADKPYQTWCCIGDQIIKHISEFIKLSKSATTSSKKEEKEPKELLTNIEEEISSEDESSDDEDEVQPIDAELEGELQLVLETMLMNKNARLEVNTKEKPKPKPEKAGAQQKIPEMPPAQASKSELEKWAVARYKEVLKFGELKSYYNGFLFSSGIKSLAIKLFGNLPVFYPNMDPSLIEPFHIFENLPTGWSKLDLFPRYLQGRQVLVRTTVNASVTSGKDGVDFLTYNPKSSDKCVTYRAIIQGEADPETFLVGVETPNKTFETIKVSKKEIYKLNQPTNFEGDEKSKLFEDGIIAKYTESVTKAKMMEAAMAIADIVPTMNFEDGKEEELLQKQFECVKRIRQVFDLIHFHNEPFDASKKRTTKPDVGRLAHYGQGNCHTMASVMAALLLPFSKLIGVEVRFRAGNFFCNGRDIDEGGEPVSGWDGKPRSIDDHTWLELTFVPSLRSVVCDPSFGQLTAPLDICYSRFGRRHPSDKLQCNSKPVQAPLVDYDSSKTATIFPREFWPRGKSFHNYVPSTK